MQEQLCQLTIDEGYIGCGSICMRRPYRGMLRGLIHSQTERAENSDTISSSYRAVLLKWLSTDLPASKMVKLGPCSGKVSYQSFTESTTIA